MLRDPVARRIVIDGSAVWTLVAGLQLMAHPAEAAQWLDLASYPWTNRLFDLGLVAALLAACFLAMRWILVLGRLARRWHGSPGESSLATASRGTLVVEFALVFPLVALVFILVIQLALLANAALVVRHAAFCSARAAIVDLERNWKFAPIPVPKKRTDGGPGMAVGNGWPRLPFCSEHLSGWTPGGPEDSPVARKAARLVLATLSTPDSSSPADKEAGNLVAIHKDQAQQWAPDSWGAADLGRRMQYASAATGTGFQELLETDAAGKVPYYSTANMALSALGSLLVSAVTGIANKVVDKIVSKLSTTIRVVLTPFVFVLKKVLKTAVEQAMKPILQRILGPILDGLLPRVYSPVGIEVQLAYDYPIPLPGLQLIPGLTQPAPAPYAGRVFRIQCSAWLQSTGTRQAHPLSLLNGKYFFDKALLD